MRHQSYFPTNELFDFHELALFRTAAETSQLSNLQVVKEQTILEVT